MALKNTKASDIAFSLRSSLRIQHSHASLLDETVDIFQGGKRIQLKKAIKKDYHGMFDGAHFASWSSVLLDALQERGLKNCVIVMDNAKYHKVLPSTTPRASWRVAALRAYCASAAIATILSDTKNMILQKLKPHVETIKPTIVAMPEDAGHTVLFTPSRYSGLQLLLLPHDLRP
jgi:hypothetical protein